MPWEFFEDHCKWSVKGGGWGLTQIWESSHWGFFNWNWKYTHANIGTARKSNQNWRHVLSIFFWLLVLKCYQPRPSAWPITLTSTFSWLFRISQKPHPINSEFMQHDVDRRKRTAKHLCVTNVTGLLLACFVLIFI